MLRLRACAAALPLLFLSIVQIVSAQTDTGSLSGRVTDAQGGVIGGSQIQLQNQATGAERRTASDETGQYTFTLIPPGRYNIEVKWSDRSDQAELRHNR